jgi:peptidoglycan/LPS O-acetylase OafA/YrhL
MTTSPALPPAHSNIPALDGLRSVAIFGVFVFHIWAALLPGGFAGVDVFFVLSGFLITSIIYNDIRRQKFVFGEFYLRRIQRLLPNAIAAVAVTLFLWYFFLPEGQSIEAGRHGIWTLFYVPNLYIWKFLGGYWGDGAEWAAFTHFWSLGIEEQYYILFPFCFFILVRLCAKFRAAFVLKLALSLAVLGSLALCLYGSYRWPAATFYSLPTRVWELLLGSALAVFTGGIFATTVGGKETQKDTVQRRVVREIAAWGGVSLIAFSFIWGSETNFVFPGVIVLAPTAGAALILWAIISGKTTLAVLLAQTPFVALGKVSYSLYLWHWPLIVFGRFQAGYAGWSLLTGALLGAGASIVLAIAAYFFIEKPLRQSGGGNRKVRLAVIASGLTAAILFCVFAVTRDGFSPDKYGRVVSSLNLYDVANKPLDLDKPAIVLKHALGDSNTFLEKLWRRTILHEGEGGRSSDLWLYGYAGQRDKDGIYKGIALPAGGEKNRRVMVIGSSHACMYSKVIHDICRETKTDALFWGYSATEIFDQPPGRIIFEKNRFLPKFYATRLKKIREWNPDVLFLIAPWNDETIERDLRKFLDETKMCKTQIVFVTELPMMNFGSRENLRAAITFMEKQQGAPPKVMPGYREDVRQRAHAIAERIAKEPQFAGRFSILPVGKLFYNADGSVRYANGKEFWYIDSNHLSDTGIARKEVRELFEKAIRK